MSLPIPPSLTVEAAASKGENGIYERSPVSDHETGRSIILSVISRLEMLKVLLPLACKWARAQEEFILTQGVPLTAPELKDAWRIGVADPNRVRLFAVERIPVPDDATLKSAAELFGFLSPQTTGLTLRYGIFIRADHWGERRLVVHELAHTAQYERFGGFDGFLSAYLKECLTIGYPDGPLEQEAIRLERQICSDGWKG